MSFDISVPNKSILVVTSYRCGSTALCSFLEKKYGLFNYEEAFHPLRDIEEFKKTYEDHNFVVKAMPNQIFPGEKSKIFNLLVDSCHTIKLKRRNTYDQVLSYFIAKSANKWNYKKSDPFTKYRLEIDPGLLDWSIEYLQSVNESLELINCDQELYYEDLGLIDCDIKKYHKPSNYNEILEMVIGHPCLPIK